MSLFQIQVWLVFLNFVLGRSFDCYSPLLDIPPFYKHFSSSPTSGANCLVTYLYCIVCFTLLSLAPVTCSNAHLKLQQGPQRLSQPHYLCCVCIYVVKCPVDHRFRVPLFLLFTFLPTYETTSNGDQESPGKGTDLSAASFFSTLHHGVPVSHLE